MTIKKEEVVSLGIVLKTQSYKESDALVTVYFKDYGKMTLIAVSYTHLTLPTIA